MTETHWWFNREGFILVRLDEEWPSVFNPGSLLCFAEQSCVDAAFTRDGQFPCRPTIVGDNRSWIVVVHNLFLYCCGTCEHHTSGRSLDYLQRLFISDMTVASCPTAFNLVGRARKPEATKWEIAQMLCCAHPAASYGSDPSLSSFFSSFENWITCVSLMTDQYDEDIFFCTHQKMVKYKHHGKDNELNTNVVEKLSLFFR